MRLVGEAGAVHRRRRGSRPDRSPVNIRPVRLAPWAAGASPTTDDAGLRVPEAGDRAGPVLPVAERGALLPSRPARATRRGGGRPGSRPPPPAAARGGSTGADDRLAPDHGTLDGPRKALPGRWCCSCGTAPRRRPGGAPRPGAGPPPRRQGPSSRPRRSAQRIAALQTDKRKVAARLRVAARAHAGDRQADRRGARPPDARSTRASSSATSASGPARELKELSKLPEWTHGPAQPERLPVPRRRVVRRDADPHRAAPSTGCGPSTPAGSSSRSRTPIPIKAAVAHALGTHLDLFQRIVVSPCSVSAILYTAGGPIVLAVNSTGDLQLRPRAPSMSTLVRPPGPGRVHRRHRRAAGPAGLLPPGPRQRHRRHAPVREATGRRARRVPRRPARRPRPAPYGVAVADVRLAEPLQEAWTVGPIGVAYDDDADRIIVVLEELVDEPTTRRDRRRGAAGAPSGCASAGPRWRRSCSTAASLVSAGRPPCRFCGLPVDPDGHPCPRMN